jgi:putative FmdB family regulatory protein
MPIYTYKCNKCDKIFDEFVLSSCSDEEIICADCKSPVKRVFSPVGIIFKGSGFYSTDYGGKKKDLSSSDNGKSSEKSKDKSQKTDTAKKQDSKDKPAASKDKANNK